MHILVLNYEYPPIGGGGGLISRDITSLLVQNGYKVTVITMHYKELNEYEVQEDGVQIFRIPCLRSSINVCHPWEQLTFILSAFIHIKKMIDRTKFDVCHCHFIIPTGLIGVYLKKIYKIPLIITAHGSDVLGHNNKRFRLLYKVIKAPWKKICQSADLIISPSHYLKMLITSNEPNCNCTVIPNGIFLQDYHSGEKSNIFLILSRLQESKGIQTMIKAMPLLADLDWTLHIAGDGPYRSSLELLVTELKVEDKVIFHGWLDNKGKKQTDLLARTKIFISASEFENFPVSVMEAIACGCIPVLSDIPAHRIFTTDNHLLFETKSSRQLATRLRWIIESQQKFSDFNLKIDQFEWNNIMINYDKIFQEVIEKSKSKRGNNGK